MAGYGDSFPLLFCINLVLVSAFLYKEPCFQKFILTIKHKTRANCSCWREPPESLFTVNGRNIPFVHRLKYFGIIFDKTITWRLHVEVIEAKTLRTFNTIYSIFKSEQLNPNIKFTILGICARWTPNYIAVPQNSVLRTICNFLRLFKFRIFKITEQIMQATSRGNSNSSKSYSNQGIIYCTEPGLTEASYI
jgi:hypothetical protein